MKRRSFLTGAAALFAAIAGTGPTLLEDREIIRGGSRLGKTYPIGERVLLLPRWQRWNAEKSLRIANHVIETAREAAQMLATGIHPAPVLAYAIARKAKLDAIQAEMPPWVQRRSVTIGPPQFQ